MKNATWRVIISDVIDPPTNLAIEEALLRSLIEQNAPNTLRIWRNQPCVIVGRSQNISEEVNLHWCETVGIPIFRRCSGGGAVYQDLGNYNYSIIIHRRNLSKLKGSTSSFQFICTGVLKAIESFGCSPNFIPPSSIYVQGGKVSGSSQYLLYHGLLQHGTLLVSADLSALKSALNSPTAKKKLRGVCSNPAPVLNLSDLLRISITPSQIQNTLIESFSHLFDNTWQFGSLSSWEENMIKQLYNLKYHDSSWTIGCL